MRAITCVSTAILAFLWGPSSGATAADKVYKIQLSNNFVGDDRRQKMLRTAQVAARKPPLSRSIQLTIDNAESTIQAQINALNNIVGEKPDAIIIDAGSGDAFNPTIEKACADGIVVVSFDQVVTAPCAYKLQSNFDTIGANQAAWMVATLSGKGNVAIDRGLAGAPVAERFVKMFEDGMKTGPDIKFVGYYTGEYSLGPEQAGVGSLLAANPQIDGILTQAYGAGAIKALQNASRPMVPIVVAAFNGTAVAVLDGKAPASKDVLLDNPLLTNVAVDGKYLPGGQVPDA